MNELTTEELLEVSTLVVLTGETLGFVYREPRVIGVRLLAALVKRGLIEKKPVPEDAQVYEQDMYRVTDAGIEAVSRQRQKTA